MNLITVEEQRKIYKTNKGTFPKYTYGDIPCNSDEVFPKIKSTFDFAPYDAFIIKVKGDSMKDAGINNGDTLLVKRKMKPEYGKIIVAEVNGKLAVKRLHAKNGKVFLVSDNKNYAPIEVMKEDKFRIWGTVSMVIKDYC